ncbi:probable JmjC domain-containing histone demethylation protein 2C isoform X2 [Antedon mediterranea]|uniref:probable JmjC domain-containing histone demethylation protein 2C isoform X2 n=1 Tax=Antedon mediterranea TaxID=105859 RepID=UPI003AF507B7
MGIEYREELVGKRFLRVSGSGKLKLNKISEWNWQAGIIRAVDGNHGASTRPTKHDVTSVYVEFDGQDWEKRDWVKVHDENNLVFLVEKTIIWCKRSDPYSPRATSILWPALNFEAIEDKLGVESSDFNPIEFFHDRTRAFPTAPQILPYEDENNKKLHSTFQRHSEVKNEVDQWIHDQKVQQILITAPYIVTGYRVKVYRIGSATQWFSAVITGHNLETRELIVMDDTVLESHTENPALVQMMFLDLDDVVVKSLLKGENVGITPRRRIAATSNTQPINTTTLSRSVPRSHSPSHANSNQNSTSSSTKKKRGQKQPDEKDMEKDKQPEKVTKETKTSANSKAKKEQRKKKTDEEKVIETVNKKEIAPAKRSRSHSTSSEVQEDDKQTDKQTVNKQEKVSDKSKSRNKSSKKTEESQTNNQEIETDSNDPILKKEKTKEKKSKSKHKSKTKERTGDKNKPAKIDKEGKKDICKEENNFVDNSISLPQDTNQVLDTAQVESVLAIEPQTIERVENPLADNYTAVQQKEQKESALESVTKVSSCEEVSSTCTEPSMVHSTSTSEIKEASSPWVGQVKQKEHMEHNKPVEYKRTVIEHIRNAEVSQAFNMEAMNSSSCSSPDVRTDQMSAINMEKLDGHKPKERDKTIEKKQNLEKEEAKEFKRELPRSHSTESNRSSLATETKEPVHVYRDPNLRENYVIHVDSVQHQHIHRGEHAPSPSQSLGPSPHSSLRPQPGLGPSPSAFAPQPVSHLPAHHHANQQAQAQAQAQAAAAHHLYAQYGLYPTHIPGISPHYASPHLSALDPSFHTRLLTDLAAQKDHFRFHQPQLSVLQRPPMMGVQPGLAMLLPSHHRALHESMEHQLRLQQHQQQQQIQQQQQHAQHSNPPSHEPLKRYQEFQTNTSDPKAAVQQHFQESLRNLSLPFIIAQQSSKGGSITKGTPAQRQDTSPARPSSEHPGKDDKRVQEEMKRKELEEKEREWQKLQREKEHRERAQNEREGYAGLLAQSDAPHMRHYMSQEKQGGDGHYHPHRPSSSSSEPKGFQVYQPPLKSEPGSQSSFYSAASRAEEFRQVVYPKVGHLNLSHKQDSSSEFMKGYQPFGHTLSSAPQAADIEHRLSVTDSRYESGFRHTDAYSKHASGKSGKDIGGPPPLIRSGRDSRTKESYPGIPFGSERPGDRKQEYNRYHLENQYHYQYGGHMRGPDVKVESGRQSAPQGKGVPVICKTPSSHMSSESPSPHHQQPLTVRTSTSQPQSPLKVASPQQLSAAVFRPMDLSQARTVNTATTSQSAATQGHASLLMSALRPNERGEITGKRKTSMEESIGPKKSKGKDGQSSPPLGPLGHPDRRPHPHHSYVHQYNWFVQDHRNNPVTGGRAAELLAKDLRIGRKEDVELKIEKVDQFENVSNVSASSPATVLSGKSDHPRINGAISDSDSTSTRSTSPSDKSKRNDPHTSPNKSAGHVSLKKAWLHRHTYTKDSSLSGPSDPKVMRFSDGSSDSPGPTSLHNGHVRQTELDKKSDVLNKTACSRFTDIPDAIPDRVYDFETSSTCSDGSSVSNSTKKKSRKSKESKKPKRKGANDKDSTPAKDQESQDANKDVKENGILQRDPATMAPKKFIQTRARKERSKSDALNITRALVKPPIAKLKKTGEAFLQDGSCCDVTPNLMKCRECRMKPSSRHSKLNIFCRFYAFRRLKYSRNSNLTIAGFSEPCHCEQEDLDPWLPYPDPDCPLDVNTSKYILSKVGDQFCDLVQQEREAKAITMENGKIAWKRAVTGVREMCDTCDTTLFNIHWTCPKCGFVVCLDCYKSRKNSGDEDIDGKYPQRWLKCIKDQVHHVENLMLTQIIPKDALWDVGEMVHKMRVKWNVNPNCKCTKNGKLAAINGTSQNILAETVLTGPKMKSKDNKNSSKTSNSNASSLQILADIATSTQSDTNSQTGESVEPLDDTKGNSTDKRRDSPSSTLRELLTKTADKLAKPPTTMSGGSFLSAYFFKGENNSGKRMVTGTFEDIIASVVEQNIASTTLTKQERSAITQTKQSKNANIQTMEPTAMFMNPNFNLEDGQVRHTLVESSMRFPDVPHSWLCDGRLLRLHDPRHKGNLRIFQEQWRRGEPVLVSGCHKVLSQKLWHPSTFSRMFGELENDLVNCRTSNVIQGVPMKEFWDGFEDIRNRLTSKNRDPMVLKLKDWPPAEDFSELLPDHFQDLMQGLPLPEYTHRNGHLNLSSRLPEFFVKPDLGPKMYNAYGSARYPKLGTTNLHLDISDAVNMMVYVGIPLNENKGKLSNIDFENDAFEAVDQSTCDELTKKRVRDKTEKPGALWHIFRAVDADKIRDMLRKVSKEQGEDFPPDHDPIHDQSFYLDKKLLERLKKDYGVQGWAIVQCMGDAVFIPAGAPHQVHNLHSCIKAAEDFVSPEHVHQCFKLTQEFRYLSSTHSNHEDKLQVKNIIYHAIKDTVGILMSHEPPGK